MGERADWYVELQGLATGPYSLETLINWATLRQLAPDSRVYNESLPQWRRLADTPELLAHCRAPLALANYVETEPVKHVPAPVKKTIPWREKKRKLWEIRRVEKPAPTETLPARPEQIPLAPQSAPIATTIPASTSAAIPAPISAAVSASIPTTPAVPTKNATALDLLEGIFREDPPAKPAATASAATVVADSAIATDSLVVPHESNFHKILFFGFLALSAVFAGASYWLSRSFHEERAAPGVAAPAAASITTAAAPGLEVIRDGKVEAVEKSEEAPDTSPTPPRAPTARASRTDSPAALKPPVRPKRE